jgi:hypothetical protein
MADQLSLRGGTSSEHASFTGANKEVTVDTTKKTLVVHDGATPGGHPIMRENGSNSALLLGSAATPALKFSGDTNTGIYSPGADQVAVATNGQGRLFVDASGNVGVNVASPASFEPDARNLVVGSGSGNNGLSIYSGTANQGIIYFADGTTAAQKYTGFITYDHNTNAMRFGTNDGNERLRITSTGLVGIGTSTPNVPLEVVGNIHMSGAADRTIFNRANNALSLGTNNTTRLHITNAGNVGIGTTSPGAILHTVNTSAGAATVGAFIQNSSLTAGTEVRLGFAPNTNLVGDNRYSWIGAVNGIGSNDSSLTFATTPGGTGATERMRITSAGQMLVGTTTGPDARATIAPASGQAALKLNTTLFVAAGATSTILSATATGATFIAIGTRGASGTGIYIAHRGSGTATLISSTGTWAGSLAWSTDDLQGTSPAGGGVSWAVIRLND